MAKKQSSVEHPYDVFVIGAGAAGISAALRARQSAKRVALADPGELGGECPNEACIPTKALLYAALQYYKAKTQWARLGISARDLEFSFTKAMRYKREVVRTITGDGKRLHTLLKENGVDIVRARASFLDAHHVKAGAHVFTVKNSIIATGSQTVVPPIAGIEQVPYLTYRDALHLKQQPKSLAIIGAGAVGCELATFFGMIGTKVWLLDISPSILPQEDRELSALLTRQFEAFGVKVYTGAKGLSARLAGKHIELTYQKGTRTRECIRPQAIVLCAGRVPNLQNISLEKAGLQVQENGTLWHSDTLQTRKKHIFVAGDATGHMMFTHTAHRDGEIAGANAVTLRKRMKRDNRVIPRVTFVYPELASVGMTALQAKEFGHTIKVHTMAVGALGRAVTQSDRVGMLKVIEDIPSGQILGAHMLAERAGEVIHELALAMHAGLMLEEIQSMVHAFPTFSESISTL